MPRIRYVQVVCQKWKALDWKQKATFLCTSCRPENVLEKSLDSGTHLAHETASRDKPPGVLEDLPLIEQISEPPSQNSKIFG